MAVEFKKCCICGAKIVGWGNNPWPVNNDEDAVCCDYCNYHFVIPARLAQMDEQKLKSEETETSQVKSKNESSKRIKREV